MFSQWLEEFCLQRCSRKLHVMLAVYWIKVDKGVNAALGRNSPSTRHEQLCSRTPQCECGWCVFDTRPCVDRHTGGKHISSVRGSALVQQDMERHKMQSRTGARRSAYVDVVHVSSQLRGPCLHCRAQIAVLCVSSLSQHQLHACTANRLHT